MKRLAGFIVAAFVLLNLNIFAQLQDSIKNISVDELRLKINKDSNLVILDVRSSEELAGPLGKIDGVINIPVQDLEKRIVELEKYKDQEIAVICRTGHRSLKASKILIENGFKKVENVKGGMTAYREEQK